MSQDDNPDRTYSLSELEKKLQDAMEAIEIIKKGENIHLGQDSLAKKYDDLKKEFEQKSNDYTELNEQFQQLTQELLELRQEKMMFEKFTTMTETEKEKMQKARDEMKTKYETEKQTALEQEQEKMFLEKEVEIEHKGKEAAVKKYYKTAIMAAIAIAVVAGVYSVMFAELAGQQYQTTAINQPSGYVIQNLRGDVIDTWIAWRIPEDDVIRVTVSGSALTPELFEITKDVFLNTEPLEIDNSLMHKGPKGTTSIHYTGWTGALTFAAETPTEFAIPVMFEVTDKGGIGDINIKLENAVNPDGFSGWTSSIVDEINNQILKSDITIYQTRDYSDNQFAAVMRHEVGHALGLAHSTAPEDLMAPTMTTEFPYISPCDIDAMIGLYDNGGHSTVTCEV